MLKINGVFMSSGNYVDTRSRKREILGEIHPFSECRVTKLYKESGKKITFILGRKAMTIDGLGIDANVAKLMRDDSDISRNKLKHDYDVTISVAP